jgi:hypothetical protein
VRALLLAGACCLGLARPAAGLSTPPPPQADRMVYYKDMPTWRAYWLLPAVPLDAWTKQFFPDAQHPIDLVEVFGWGAPKVWYAFAPRNEIEFPYIEVLKDDDDGPNRHVEFALVSKNRAPDIEVWIQGYGGNASTVRTSVNGRVLTDTLSRTYALSLHGMRDRRLHFSFDMDGHPAFRIIVQERIPGLPGPGLPEKPAGLTPALLPMTGTTIATDTMLFR